MWLPKEGKSILLFSNKISKSGISVWATTRGRPYEIIFMQPNNNLPICFLLGHSDKLFVNSNLSFAKQKTAITSLLGHTTAGVYCVAQTFRLMLLGLPPDMVHGALSHRTRRRMTQ